MKESRTYIFKIRMPTSLINYRKRNDYILYYNREENLDNYNNEFKKIK